MSNHLTHILQEWLKRKTSHEWALGVVANTEGPVYRKTGAIMLLSDRGDQLGMLSGGCLEGDILLHAQRAILKNESTRVIYDANEKGGLAWRLGIGCGGKAEIVIHPCNSANHFLELEQLHQTLSAQRPATYNLNLEHAEATISASSHASTGNSLNTTETFSHNNSQWLRIHAQPRPHLVISGAGVDMQPIAALAGQLGWKVTLVDSRQANARQRHFPSADNVFCCPIDELPQDTLAQCDALIIANHNLNMDAQALKAAQLSSARYIGLLGPAARREKIFALAEIKESESKAIAGPMGLALGNDLPESIALSVLAECHAVLFGSSGQPLSNHYWN